MNRPIKLLLVDDHELMREMLARRLADESDMTVVGNVGTADEAVAETIRQKPDIILMDIDMPGRLCFDAAQAIQSQSPNTGIIFLSAFFHDRYIEQALACQAAGYVTKNEPAASVVMAIRAAATGGSYFSPQVEARIIVDADGIRLLHKKQSRAATLTPREVEVLRYVARGLSEAQIARTMYISPKTVHNHTNNVMAKLDIHKRVELSRFAIREGLAEA